MIKNKGFTLMELMIVVAIVGILGAIAYPSYQDSVLKSRRAEAQADLVELSGFVERFFTTNNSYTAVILPFTSSPRTGPASYTLSKVSGASSYTLTATPLGGQLADSCGTLTLNQIGQQTPATNCW